jgi:hypothetical protein
VFNFKVCILIEHPIYEPYTAGTDLFVRNFARALRDHHVGGFGSADSALRAVHGVD